MELTYSNSAIREQGDIVALMGRSSASAFVGEIALRWPRPEATTAVIASALKPKAGVILASCTEDELEFAKLLGRHRADNRAEKSRP